MNDVHFSEVAVRRWPLIGSFVLAGLLLALLVSAFQPKEYAASSTVYISSQSGQESTLSAYQGSLLSQERVKSYTSLVASDRVTSQVVSQLRLPESPEELGSQIAVSSEPETVVLTITVTQGDPSRSAVVANAVTQSFMSLVAELERPSVANVAPSILVKVVQGAEPPISAEAPDVRLNCSLGVLAGLLLGALCATLVERSDDSVRSREQFESISTSPVLGTVPQDDRLTKTTTLIREEPYDPVSEAIRALRTNIEFLDFEADHRVYAISSARAGEGKSTVLLNLAISLADSGRSVLVIDGDLRRPTIASKLGIDGGVGLTTVVARGLHPKDAIQWIPSARISVVASGALPPNPAEVVGSTATKSAIKFYTEKYEIVLIDTPPLLPVTDAALLGSASTGVFIVTAEASAKIRELRGAIASLRATGSNVAGVILNRGKRSASSSYRYSYYKPEPSPDSDVELPSRSVKARPTPTPFRR